MAAAARCAGQFRGSPVLLGCMASPAKDEPGWQLHLLQRRGGGCPGCGLQLPEGCGVCVSAAAGTCSSRQLVARLHARGVFSVWWGGLPVTRRRWCIWGRPLLARAPAHLCGSTVLAS